LKKFLLWAPRLLAIAFALFLALFALDVFGEGYTGQRLLLALVMHLKWPAMVLAGLALGVGRHAAIRRAWSLLLGTDGQASKLDRRHLRAHVSHRCVVSGELGCSPRAAREECMKTKQLQAGLRV